MTIPAEGEIWRNNTGAIRYVRHIDNDSYSVTYTRPANSHADWCTVLMRDWQMWAKNSNAVRLRRAAACTDKDW